jgi:hypothetical protein
MWQVAHFLKVSITPGVMIGTMPVGGNFAENGFIVLYSRVYKQLYRDAVRARNGNKRMFISEQQLQQRSIHYQQ